MRQVVIIHMGKYTNYNKNIFTTKVFTRSVYTSYTY